MFRYKANLASKTLSEEHSKITRLSSGESYSSKDGVDPGKDSWVFSKETPNTRIHRDTRRKAEPDTQDTRLEEETFSIQTRETPIEENMKVNVLYRGMVYRIRGIKIICSILAGVILLLAAVVILGIWIILGASDDGKFYFPWSQSPANESSKDLLPDIDSNLANLTKIGGFMLLPDSEEPSIYDSGGEISYKIPSEEVGEALGHLQAAHPPPANDADFGNQDLSSTESHLASYDEYYYEYDEDYRADGDVEYSLLHPTFVEAPSNFFQKLPKNFKDDETIQPESYENDFRVHFDGSGNENKNINVPHLVKPSDRDDDRTQSFRPSPRIPERSSSAQATDSERNHYRNDDRKFDVRHPDVQEFVSDEGVESFPKRPFTNAHITRSNVNESPNTNQEKFKYETAEISNEYDNLNDDYYKDTTVVQYDEILIAKTPQEDPIYFEPSESNEPERKTLFSRDYSNQERDDLRSNGGDIRPLVATRGPLPPAFVESTSDDEDEEDPHRSLFVGKYDSSQVILDENSFKSSPPVEIRNRETIRERRPLAPPRRHPDSRIEERTRFPIHSRNPVPIYHHGANRKPFFTPPLNPHLRVPPVSRRPVPGTVHPIPHIRRSHISAGYRPRFDNPNFEALHMKDLRNSKRPSQAEHFADSVIAESITYPSVVRVDGSPVIRRGPMPFNAINPQRMGAALPSHEFPPQGRLPPSVDNRNPIYFEQEKETGFLGALQRMYDYSSRIASSLISFPAESDLNMTNSTTDFLKNSFGLLSNYDNIFQNLPEVFMQPLKQFRVPSVDQLDELNPFELSLMTWTFIDFWEFLIEKVGTLSKEDLRILEMRLEKIREQKDNSMARAFIDSIPSSDDITDNEEVETAVKTFKLSLLNDDSTDKTDGVVPIADGGSEVSVATTVGASDSLRAAPAQSPSNAREARSRSKHNWADPLGLFSSEQRTEFMQYTIKTLFNFGKVYLRSDYALDCMMLLFCKDINAKTKYGGMNGIAARLKSVGLKVLVDREGRETDTVTGVWQALTKWEALNCDVMFPKCDGSKALEIVNEVANAARRR